jgi:hypothetical protein
MLGDRLKRSLGGAIVAFSGVLLAGCAPLHLWETHTTSTPTPRSLDVTTLARERVATLGLQAPAGLQGFGPSLSHALNTALSAASPPIPAIPEHRTVNVLNEQRLGTDYAELISSFGRSGIFDRERLQRIGAALGSRYVLQPGLVQFNEALIDSFEAAGFKLVRSRVTTLRLWLQLWDTQTGELLWQSSGETVVAASLLAAHRTVPLDEIAQRPWLRMIQDDLLSEKTGARLPASTSLHVPPGRPPR